MIKNDELLIYTQLDKIDTDDLKQKFISIIKYGKFNLFDSFNIYGSAIFKYDDTILAYCDKQLSFPFSAAGTHEFPLDLPQEQPQRNYTSQPACRGRNLIRLSRGFSLPCTQLP